MIQSLLCHGRPKEGFYSFIIRKAACVSLRLCCESVCACTGLLGVTSLYSVGFGGEALAPQFLRLCPWLSTQPVHQKILDLAHNYFISTITIIIISLQCIAAVYTQQSSPLLRMPGFLVQCSLLSTHHHFHGHSALYTYRATCFKEERDRRERGGGRGRR